MGFLKRILGVEELENNVNKEFSQIKQNLKTSWNWINYLHELEQGNRAEIKRLTAENSELKELLKEGNRTIQEPVKPASSEEKKEKPNKEPKAAEAKEPVKSELTFKNIDISGIGKKEAFVLQILYQLACFDDSSSIETGKIFNNLPYTITKRGLRKKLYKLQEQGIIDSVMYGNTRKWFLDMNKLAKLKQFLARRAV
ncbi:MAG: hypothetical protein JW791_00275 [Nanoarchaeota archaeon]|nr:hypothetical protein [Nanoarchaeota archaeon]